MFKRQAKATAEFHIRPETRVQVEASFLTDQGPARTSNEDSVAAIVPADPEVLRQRGVLAVVADGMGGHEGGEVASTTAVQTVNSTFYSTNDDIQKALVDAFQLANRKILEQARREKNLAGMGTTCTAVAVKEGLAYCAHVGDSRAYLVRKGQAYRMTEDHSVTMELVNRGLLTLAEANHHEDRNVILRAMGTQPKLEVSTWKEPFPLLAGDSLVLCSDGLYEVVGDDEIGRLCEASATPGAACRALIDAALQRQCTDNVTAAVIRVTAAATAEGGQQ